MGACGWFWVRIRKKSGYITDAHIPTHSNRIIDKRLRRRNWHVGSGWAWIIGNIYILFFISPKIGLLCSSVRPISHAEWHKWEEPDIIQVDNVWCWGKWGKYFVATHFKMKRKRKNDICQVGIFIFSCVFSLHRTPQQSYRKLLYLLRKTGKNYASWEKPFQFRCSTAPIQPGEHSIASPHNKRGNILVVAVLVS